VVETPEIHCDDTLPPADRQRLLPGHAVAHQRSCHDGHCFADTCHYRKDVHDKGVQVLYDCRESTEDGAVRTSDYFSTARKNARAIPGLGTSAAVDQEGLTFYDGDARCLVTIRSDGGADRYLELARVIEGNLSARTVGRE
jgi:hypothetical protein